MTRSAWDYANEAVFRHEGGYSSHKRDPGNWTGGKIGVGRLVGTNMGISAPTLASYRGEEVTAADMTALTKEEAAAIYKRQYADPIRFERLPDGLNYIVYDSAVHSGVSRGSKWLQAIVGAKVDGFIGINTLRAVADYVEAHSVADLIKAYVAVRLRFLERLKTWKTFGKGWARRLDQALTLALQLDRHQPDEEWLATFRPVPGKADGETKLPTTEKAKDAATGIGAAGTAATEAAKQIEPLAETSNILQWAFIALLMIGVALTMYSLWKRNKGDGDAVTA